MLGTMLQVRPHSGHDKLQVRSGNEQDDAQARNKQDGTPKRGRVTVMITLQVRPHNDQQGDVTEFARQRCSLYCTAILLLDPVT